MKRIILIVVGVIILAGLVGIMNPQKLGAVDTSVKPRRSQENVELISRIPNVNGGGIDDGELSKHFYRRYV